MNPTFKVFALGSTVLALMGLAGCNRNESPTVGQSVDKSIAQAKEKGAEAKVATQDAAKAMATGATDAAITTKVNAALVTDATLKVTKVDVDTKNGRVVLTGTAPDAAARDRATAMVKAVDGVVEVDNQLRIATKP